MVVELPRRGGKLPVEGRRRSQPRITVAVRLLLKHRVLSNAVLLWNRKRSEILDHCRSTWATLNRSADGSPRSVPRRSAAGLIESFLPRFRPITKAKDVSNLVAGLFGLRTPPSPEESRAIEAATPVLARSPELGRIRQG